MKISKDGKQRDESTLVNYPALVRHPSWNGHRVARTEFLSIPENNLTPRIINRLYESLRRRWRKGGKRAEEGVEDEERSLVRNAARIAGHFEIEL